MLVRRKIPSLAVMAISAGFVLGCGDAASLPDKPSPNDCVNAPAGTFHDQKLVVGGEERYYMLHVPEMYSCAKPIPLFVDFHGTSTEDRPEESYAQEDLEKLADTKGFILVRPRSRAGDEDGTTIYRWDQNDGDIERNTKFAESLVSDIIAQYRIDPARMYVAGFSSGTNMAAQLLADTTFAFAGFGFVGGGAWNDPGLSTYTTDAPRIYTVTGYRDYMYEYLLELDDLLDAAKFPSDNHKNREVHTGHDLYGWHYEEMWDWIDRGVAQQDGDVNAPWTAETIPTKESLLALATNPAGDVFASGSGGSFFKRDHTSGEWSLVGHVGNNAASYATALCFLPSGTGIAVGGTIVAKTEDGGSTWTMGQSIPEFQRNAFGSSYLNAITCGQNGHVYAGGYWTGVTSADGGKTWLGAEMKDEGYLAQVAAIAARDNTVISVGYYGYIGRSSAGEPFTSMAHPGESQWFTGVAGADNGNFWVVGEAGEILHSADDGQTWNQQNTPRNIDLYGVSFRDASTGITVGRSGAAFVTKNGGQTWEDASTGKDRFFGAAAFVGTNEVIIVGEKGIVLRRTL